MAIQQIFQISLVLQGDGVSTVFTYSFSQLLGLAANGFNPINLNAIPSAALQVSPDGVLPNYIPTLDQFGNLVLTFDNPWTGAGTATVQLLYNSGNLAGSATSWNSATPATTYTPIELNGEPTILVDTTISGGSINAGTL